MKFIGKMDDFWKDRTPCS